jgi:hypothetical protein
LVHRCEASVKAAPARTAAVRQAACTRKRATAA